MKDKVSSTSLAHTLSALTVPESPSRVGLILTERFVNMPPQVASPMYTMLLEEISWALNEKEPYDFTHYLILSRVYEEEASSMDDEHTGPQRKKRKGESLNEIMYFHPEDEVLHKYAIGSCDFNYSRANEKVASGARRAFVDKGISSKGHLILLGADRFDTAVNAIAEFMKT